MDTHLLFVIYDHHIIHESNLDLLFNGIKYRFQWHIFQYDRTFSLLVKRSGLSGSAQSANHGKQQAAQAAETSNRSTATTSELQSLMHTSSAVFCFKTKTH